jgi:hypothetical protein
MLLEVLAIFLSESLSSWTKQGAFTRLRQIMLNPPSLRPFTRKERITRRLTLPQEKLQQLPVQFMVTKKIL